MLGAIAVLFLFVVIMLNLQLAELSAVGSEYTQNLPLGAIVGSLFLFELVSILPFSFKDAGSFDLTNITSLVSPFQEGELGLFNWMNSFLLPYSVTPPTNVHLVFTNSGVVDSNFTNYIQIQSIGQSLYTYGSVWLLLTSIILLLAIAGPITLSMNKEYTNNSSLTVSPFHFNIITILTVWS